MNLSTVLATLAELRNEKNRIEEAIRSLERLVQVRPRRGRPPKWLVEERKKESQNDSGPPTKIGPSREDRAEKVTRLGKVPGGVAS